MAQAEVRLCAFDFASVSRALPLKGPVILSAAKDPSSPFVSNEHPRATPSTLHFPPHIYYFAPPPTPHNPRTRAAP